MNNQITGRILEYVDIKAIGEPAFDLCAESIAAQMEDKEAVVIQSVFDFAETDVPFALRLIKNEDKVSISFANADWQFFRTRKSGDYYDFECPVYKTIDAGKDVSALALFDRAVGSYIINQESSVQSLKETLKELLKSEYFFDEDPKDYEHDLSYYVIE